MDAAGISVSILLPVAVCLRHNYILIYYKSYCSLAYHLDCFELHTEKD